MATIIDPTEQAKARAAALDDMDATVRTLGRRAQFPAERVAFAELQQELTDIRARWQTLALLPAAAEPTAAPEAA